MDEFFLSNISRSPSYIATYTTPSTLPPVDANTVLAYHFDGHNSDRPFVE